jgi:hypothetical protein
LRVLFPYAVWRPAFRLWLRTIAAQPDKRRAMRQLLELYHDAYEGPTAARSRTTAASTRSIG